jgi:hypothetical protein
MRTKRERKVLNESEVIARRRDSELEMLRKLLKSREKMNSEICIA